MNVGHIDTFVILWKQQPHATEVTGSHIMALWVSGGEAMYLVQWRKWSHTFERHRTPFEGKWSLE